MEVSMSSDETNKEKLDGQTKEQSMIEDEAKNLPIAHDAPRVTDDGFDDLNVEDGDRVIQGKLLRFTNEATWECAGEEVPPDFELVAISVRRVIQRWHDGTPIQTIFLAPKEPWPNIKAMNDAVPREDWEDGPDGNPRGPFQGQYVVYLWDPDTGEKYTYPTGTTGGGICVRELISATQLTREYRGKRVYPVVTLSDIFMSTRFGGRQRPHLPIKRWIKFGGGDALPAPDKPKLQGPQAVTPPTAKEVTEDEIPF
jgi:hypothetical protein